jgi:hypothetical protein
VETSEVAGPALRIPGLDPAATYRVQVTDLTADGGDEPVRRTGAELAEHALDWDLTDPLTARIIEAHRV